jgi:hypothetical protein
MPCGRLSLLPWLTGRVLGKRPIEMCMRGLTETSDTLPSIICLDLEPPPADASPPVVRRCQIGLLTAYFFVLYFLAATQDIAVDGWALTMLKVDQGNSGMIYETEIRISRLYVFCLIGQEGDGQLEGVKGNCRIIPLILRTILSAATWVTPRRATQWDRRPDISWATSSSWHWSRQSSPTRTSDLSRSPMASSRWPASCPSGASSFWSRRLSL